MLSSSLTTLAHVLQGLLLPIPVIGSHDLAQKGPATTRGQGRDGKLYNWFLKTLISTFAVTTALTYETSLHTENKIDRIVLKSSEIY